MAPAKLILAIGAAIVMGAVKSAEALFKCDYHYDTCVAKCNRNYRGYHGIGVNMCRAGCSMRHCIV